MNKPCPVVVLISGNGSNLQALIDASSDSSYRVTAVISNNPDAFGLERAAAANIPSWVINHRDFSNRIEFDRALIARLDQLQPGLVVLAGFMRILSAEFVNHFAGRLLNIHPSLLPRYTGTNTHQRALDAGDTEHGASVHFVTEELDGGPVIAHAVVAIAPDDNATILQEKVHHQEHLLYPQVVALFADSRLTMKEGRAWLDGEPLPPTGLRVN